MRILFVAPRILGTKVPSRTLATFHEADVRLLEELGHEVDVLPWRGKPWLALTEKALRADAIYVWTVGDHTALAALLGRVLRKPCLVVIGGYEFANLPDLGYGNLARPRGQVLSGIAYRCASDLLFVDPSLIEEARSAFGARRSGRVHSVPTGYDSGYWHPGGDKENLVLTVAHAPGTPTLSLKGVDRFVRLASHLPDVEFHVAGELPPGLGELRVPSNVRLHGWIERGEILGLMQRAKVYAQLSRHEGLPNAVCEAMLCGCIPMGTNVNGIPTAIGDAGVITESEERDAETLRLALRMSETAANRERARRRIVETFPRERRRSELSRILEASVGATRQKAPS